MLQYNRDGNFMKEQLEHYNRTVEKYDNEARPSLFSRKKSQIHVNKLSLDFDFKSIDFQINTLIRFFAAKKDHISIRLVFIKILNLNAHLEKLFLNGSI